MAKKKGEKEKAEEHKFTVGLQQVYKYPKKKRANKAITLLKRFVFKHLRIEEGEVLISNNVNQEIWKKGREHMPRKIEIKVIVDKGKANVFLKSEKVALPKEEKKEERKEEKKTEAEIAAEEEKKKKEKEKKMVEKAAETSAIKRGTFK